MHVVIEYVASVESKSKLSRGFQMKNFENKYKPSAEKNLNIISIIPFLSQNFKAKEIQTIEIQTKYPLISVQNK